MDNYFYEERQRKSVREPEKPKGFMTRVVIVQLVLSLLITGALYLVCRTDSNLSQNIKDFYVNMSKTDIAVSSILENAKNIAKETFSPSVEEATNN